MTVVCTYKAGSLRLSVSVGNTRRRRSEDKKGGGGDFEWVREKEKREERKGGKFVKTTV